MKIKFKIQRFNPEIDKVPYYQEYELDVQPSRTIMDCLNSIKWTLDSSLTFRRSCRSAICGSCAARVNKKAMLVCRELAVKNQIKGEILIEPLKNVRVLRDLVVDNDAFLDKLKTTMPWLHFDEEQKIDDELLLEEDVFQDAHNCIMCGCCQTECDVAAVDEDYLGPAAFVKAYRFIVDPRDDITVERLAILTKKGLFDCMHSFQCTELCPKDIKPSEKIRELQGIVVNETRISENGPRTLNYFYDSVRNSGKVNEAFYPLGVKGLKSVGMAGMALDMIVKNRIPPLEKKIKRIKDIGKIYELIEREEEDSGTEK